MKILYWAPGLPYTAAEDALARAGGAETPREFWASNGPGLCGRIYYAGADADGNEVYAVGLGGAASIGRKAVEGILSACCETPVISLIRSDARCGVRGRATPVRTALGHAVWRYLGLKNLGLALLAAGPARAGGTRFRYAPQRDDRHPVSGAEDQAFASGGAGEALPASIPRPNGPGDRFVFYHCYGSAHSSVATAAIHLGLLPASRVPAVRELLALRWFDRVRHDQIGTPVYLGEDQTAARVFVLGLGPSRSAARRFVSEATSLCGLDGRVSFVDCLPLAGGLVRVGGFLSRRLGVVRAGRFLAAVGVRRQYWRFVSLACRTRLRLAGRSTAGPATPRY
ncbi:MAG: DUF3189 family protein [Firmicutes bacterium]|nr:DUF3189 family protein [Bacillota bacterium]